MPSPLNSSDNYIKNGLIYKRLYKAPQTVFFLNNIVRICQENQTKMLADQTIRDGWQAAPLVPIPAARWHVGSGKDFNALSANIIFTEKSQEEHLVSFELVEANLLITVEEGTDPADIFRRSDSYRTAFKEIIKMFFLFGPNDLQWDQANNRYIDSVISEAKIIGSGLVNSANLPGIQRPLGFLPTLNFSFKYSPAINEFKLP
jgi:hypothetical protein